MGKVFQHYVLLTGGHTGIGLGLTEKILKDHPDTKIGLIIRSESRKQATMDQFQRDLNDQDGDISNRIDFFYADLSDQAQVKTAAGSIPWPQLDILVCNAGIITTEYQTSPSGNELGLEINALSHVVLLQTLTPLLRKAPHPQALITVTEGMKSRKLHLKLLDDKSRKGPTAYYMQNKQAALLMMFAAGAEANVAVRGVNPGPNRTPMTDEVIPGFLRPVARLMFTDPSVGSGRLYRAAYSFQDASQVVIDYDKAVKIQHGMTGEQKASLFRRISESDC